jgi:Caspase domain
MTGQLEDLSRVFKEDYGFEVEESIIDSKSNPQIKLNMDLATFVFKHHKPDTLIIIYYAGHGSALPTEGSITERDEFILFE